MLTTLLNSYKESFSGLRKEVWWLASVMLINRAGSMVIPFLSLFLTAELGFSLEQVGWIMSAYGLGSLIGSWLGGKLTDIWGFYAVMFWSLIASGFLFVSMLLLRSFEGFCIGIFILTVVTDIFRPAGFVAINAYSKPENRTRSVTLIRLAINAAFSVGPVAGGLIITHLSYNGLFWVDGITCIAAAMLFVLLLDRKQAKKDAEQEKKEVNVSPYRDRPYLLFLFITFLIGFAFLQFLSTIPLYYRDVHHLSEASIGWLFALNGVVIFFLEMPLVGYLEKAKHSMYRIIFGSALLIAASFAVMNFTSWVGILVISMLLMTVGEMLNFPFLNRFALDRAEKGSSGAYMALFSIAFSLAHILGTNSGLQLVEKLGFSATWYIMTGVLLVAGLLVFFLRIIVKNEIEGGKI